MRRIISTAALLVGLYLLFGSGRTGGVKAGQAAPPFSGRTLEGTALTLESLRGKVVLLDFWATWCGPCRQAAPHMRELAKKYAGKNVAIVGINQDGAGKESTVREYVKQVGLPFPQVMDGKGEIFLSYGFQGIPTMVVVDPKGTVQQVIVGFAPGVERKLEAAIDGLL